MTDTELHENRTSACPAGMRYAFLPALLAWSLCLLPCGQATAAEKALNLGADAFSFSAWFQTQNRDFVLFSKATAQGEWKHQSKALFVRGGFVAFDVLGAGDIHGRIEEVNHRWRHVVLVSDPAGKQQELFVDGVSVTKGSLGLEPDPADTVLKIGGGPEGHTESNYAFVGKMADVRLFARVLSTEEIQALAAGKPAGDQNLVLHLKLDGDPQEAKKLALPDKAVFAEGKSGKALEMNGWGYFLAQSDGQMAWAVRPWRSNGSDSERKWEQEDGLWQGTADCPEAQALRFAKATARRWPPLAEDAARQAEGARDMHGYYEAQRLYRRACLQNDEQMLAWRKTPQTLSNLRECIASLKAQYPAQWDAAPCLSRLDALETRVAALPALADVSSVADLNAQRDALIQEASRQQLLLRGIGQVAFVKRKTYNSNHYYTEYLNSAFMPGGGLCVLDLKDGSVREIPTPLKDGVFERFDLSFDAKSLLFAWKAEAGSGYRIYEVNLDGSGFRQVTFPPPDEKEIVARYQNGYHHGTDDMMPCYLPDGGIAFISTRCQYGILCDSPDSFTTTDLYRVDADGKNMRPLSNSSVSEAAPSVLEDGRIIYTRWEYVDKGAVSVKCLWAMQPDGSGSSEIYKNDIALPPSFLYGRGIPGIPTQFVALGAPHFPQNGMGTVIRLDMTKNSRTREPMTYMTPYTDVRGEGGWEFQRPDGTWYGDGEGHGPLFKDPYPLSRDLFLVAHKPQGLPYTEPTAYGLYLLDEKGTVQLLYKDPAISSWIPYPIVPRKRPAVLPAPVNAKLAKARQAQCVITDIYKGMEDVPPGTIKYLRVLEQMPRPWAARRPNMDDEYDQQHVVITKDTHLALKVQHGIVPVEEDGSANFLVPAEANIFFQALDKNYMAVQTERTYVNYMPGEVRSCVGCHETSKYAPAQTKRPKALGRTPVLPGPQPGEKDGRRALDYAQDVQPVWDAHCLTCHSGDNTKGKLDLSGEKTRLFNVSYENLVPERRKGFFDRGVLGPVIGENHPKTGNVEYLPARSLGSHASVLVAMLSKGQVKLADPKKQERADKLAEVHKKITLTREELLRLTNWVDTNCQYYGSWWGRRNLKYKDEPDFRPPQTFDMARSRTAPPGLEPFKKLSAQR